jgi:molybdopterin molybdotransferase
MTSPLALAEAQARLLGAASPLGTETVALDRAAGRYLAEPLLARRTQPAADLSAMDGYAVRADEAAGPWTVAGESAAGHPYGRELAPGEAVRISTGALMPPGEVLMLLQENALREGGRLALNGDGVPEARHIRRTGFDFREGTGILAAGTRLGPAQLALAIASGHARLGVGRLPSLAILDSGDELSADPAACAPHRIPASNGAMIAAMAAPYVSAIARLGPVADTMDALAAALRRSESADVVVTTGGASVGDHDLVRPALEAWGAEIDFWRVAMKPGKPLLVARRESQWIIGLPGNPVSSYVTAFLFLLPLLRRLGGSADPLPRILRFALGANLPEGDSRLEFVRARQEGGTVTPLGNQDSSAMRTLAAANALIRREIHAPAGHPGELVEVHLLENAGVA